MSTLTTALTFDIYIHDSATSVSYFIIAKLSCMCNLAVILLFIAKPSKLRANSNMNA